jgi:hypothetical protein
MPKDVLDKAASYAFNSLKRHEGKIERLPEVMQTLIRVYSAQGVLDNGGLQYFFESDWNGNPAYSTFVESYRQIGAMDAAEALDRAVSLFDFENPHLDAKRRQDRMEELWEDHSNEFANLDARLCGNESVWTQLKRFVEQHTEVFQINH